jgi:hypothetical protein
LGVLKCGYVRVGTFGVVRGPFEDAFLGFMGSFGGPFGGGPLGASFGALLWGPPLGPSFGAHLLTNVYRTFQL